MESVFVLCESQNVFLHWKYMFKLALAPEDLLVLVKNNRQAEIKYLCLEIGICTVWYVVYKNLFVHYLYCKPELYMPVISWLAIAKIIFLNEFILSASQLI